MAAKKTVQEKADSLLGFLYSVKDNKKIMADCKRGFRNEKYIWKYIRRFVNLSYEDTKAVYAIIISSFALYPHKGEGLQFGTVCKRISKKHSSFDIRFERLLEVKNPQGLFKRIRPFIEIAFKNNLPINYKQLFVDLYYWNLNDRAKVNWANYYWGQEEEIKEKAE